MFETDEEQIKQKAKEYAFNEWSDNEKAFIAGAKLLQEENERLQKQIEKMKNCPNCANDCIYCNEEEKDCDKCPCATCENKSHWKLKE